jgi:hypothetical protein
MIKWIDPTCYQYYDELVTLSQCFIEDYSEWIKKYTPTHDAERFNDRFKTKDDLGWTTQSIVNGKIVNIKNAAAWPRSINQIKSVVGLVNAYVNFIMPFKVIPPHTDDYFEKNLFSFKSYGTVIGISIPSNDPKVVGFQVGGIIRGWSTGDIVCFDGNVIHSGWNYSDKVRVTALLDIEQKYWKMN